MFPCCLGESSMRAARPPALVLPVSSLRLSIWDLLEEREGGPRMLCACYLVVSKHMERSGPVAAAIRAAGYMSKDEEGEEEGSSVEEEPEDGEAGEEDMEEEAKELPLYF
ncbi:hypothetical protein C0992_006582 [Termitomyces sp. T32_za158]|nr:hypothetical protein C0992_006582 [Termitomyces sp. T32_za158]